jgi:Na+/H+ antiporter
VLLSLAIPAAHPLITSPVAIFLVVLLIMLCAPMILNRLKIPHVIGLILAGVLVGPHGFNILARDMSFEVFGQVGILYLMFLAGLEIDMYHLKRNIGRGAVFGLYTFFIPLLIGAAGAYIFLGLDLLTSTLLASMFAAHTLLAYPIISRLGLSKNPAVIIAIAGTIFTVLGSLTVLAGVVGVCHDGAFSILGTLKLLAMLVIYCILTVYLFPRIARWFFKRYSDGIMQFIFVLAVVFVAAQSAVAIGIEGVFGAFMAGLVLNRYVPARSPLMSRIEFVGNAIFIPYFLIGVGMLINMGVLLKGWNTVYVATVMSVIAMGSKWLAAYAAQRTYHLKPIDRSVLYQLTNAHTAVALAVVMIGYNMHIFGEEILNGTVIMILVTCTVSSIGTSRAATRLKVLEMSDSNVEKAARTERRKPINTLIAVGSPLTAPELVNLAVMMRGTVSKRSSLYALHVRNDNTASSRAVSRNSLDVAEQTAASADVKLSSLERYDMNFVTGMINTIEERDITDVVIGLHRRNAVIDSFFGDKLSRLLRATNKMIVISRCFIPINTITRIVVAVPEKAEYETGFVRWVSALGNLTRDVGCRIIFCCYAATRKSIHAVLRHGEYDIRSEFRTIEAWDDFILLSNKILPDDLFVVVNARRTSVSFTSDLDTLPQFLQRYMASNNLLVLYPEQFGDESPVPTMAETLSTDVVAAPSPLWLSLTNKLRALISGKSSRTPKIDL